MYTSRCTSGETLSSRMTPPPPRKLGTCAEELLSMGQRPTLLFGLTPQCWDHSATSSHLLLQSEAATPGYELHQHCAANGLVRH